MVRAESHDAAAKLFSALHDLSWRFRGSHAGPADTERLGDLLMALSGHHDCAACPLLGVKRLTVCHADRQHFQHPDRGAATGTLSASPAIAIFRAFSSISLPFVSSIQALYPIVRRYWARPNACFGSCERIFAGPLGPSAFTTILTGRAFTLGVANEVQLLTQNNPFWPSAVVLINRAKGGFSRA